MNNLNHNAGYQASLLLCALLASTQTVANSAPNINPPMPCVANAPITMTPVCGDMNNGSPQTYPNSILACSTPGIIGYQQGACPNKPGIVKQAKIAGTIVFENNIRLPPGTITTVTLENNSIADASAQILGRHILRGAQTFPIQFTIPYKTSLINPAILQHPIGYGVRVRIEKQGKLLFTNDTFTPAFSGGAITLPVIQVR